MIVSLIREDDGDRYCSECGHQRLDNGGTMTGADVDSDNYPEGLVCAGCEDYIIEPDEDWCSQCEALMRNCLEGGCEDSCCGYEPPDDSDDGRCQPGTCETCDSLREQESSDEEDDEDEPPAPAPETPEEAALELALREAVQA